MAVVTSDLLAATLVNFRAIHALEYEKEAALAMTRKIASVIPSTSEIESYQWLGQVPHMREWLDERVPRGLGRFTWDIKNKDFEASIEVDRNAFRYDKLNMVKPRVMELAAEAARYPDVLLATLINAGDATLCYDGQNFFDTDHSEGDSGTIDNDLEFAAGDPPTAAELGAQLGVVLAAMMGFKDDRGRAMGIVGDTVLCPPSLMFKFREVLNSTIISSTTNVMQGVCDLIVSPYLTDSATTPVWYVLCTKRPVRPFIYQQFGNAEFVALDKPDSPELFMRKKILYGVDLTCNVGYGQYRYAVRVVNT